MMELLFMVLEGEAEFVEGVLKPVSVKTAILGLAEIQPGLIRLQSSFYYLGCTKHLQTSTDLVFTGPSYSHFNFFRLSQISRTELNIETVCIFSSQPEDASFRRMTTKV